MKRKTEEGNGRGGRRGRLPFARLTIVSTRPNPAIGTLNLGMTRVISISVS